MSIWGSLIQGLFQLGGVGAQLGGQRATFNKSLTESKRARHFAYEMDRTKYQRAVADMRAAGLNPVLAAGGVSGAQVNAPMAQLSGSLGAGMAEAGKELGRTAARAKSEIDILRANAETARNTAESSRHNVFRDMANARTAEWQTAATRQGLAEQVLRMSLLGQEAARTSAQTDMIRLGLPAARNAARYDSSPAGEVSSQVNRFLRDVRGEDNRR